MIDKPSIAPHDQPFALAASAPNRVADAAQRTALERPDLPDGGDLAGHSSLDQPPRQVPASPLPRSWQSPRDPARRYAVQGDLFYKIALTDVASAGLRRRQDLRGEARLLRRCQGIPGVPELVACRQSGATLVLITRRLDARPLSQLDVGVGQLLGLTWRLAFLVARLASRGVSHDDLRPENILVDGAGRVHLIDFDQASSGSCIVCLARSFLGLNLGSTRVSNAITAPWREHVQARLPPAVIRCLKGRRHRGHRPGETALPKLPPDASPALRALHAAWCIAARSDASSPGEAVAYYRLEFEGVCLPGERAWAERWDALRRITVYRGRRVLELGCNLGLLSIFLLKDAGASAALAVDREPAILAAGTEAAKAFGVRPTFRRIDFDLEADWEVALEAFRPEVVFALSVTHWVRNQARFLAFLGRFDELIYEGHDSARLERRRLSAAGFSDIELVDTSERGRPVLHCRKPGAT